MLSYPFHLWLLPDLCNLLSFLGVLGRSSLHFSYTDDSFELPGGTTGAAPFIVCYFCTFIWGIVLVLSMDSTVAVVTRSRAQPFTRNDQCLFDGP